MRQDCAIGKCKVGLNLICCAAIQLTIACLALPLTRQKLASPNPLNKRKKVAPSCRVPHFLKSIQRHFELDDANGTYGCLRRLHNFFSERGVLRYSVSTNPETVLVCFAIVALRFHIGLDDLPVLI
jgi:hypothetical protein